MEFRYRALGAILRAARVVLDSPVSPASPASVPSLVSLASLASARASLAALVVLAAVGCNRVEPEPTNGSAATTSGAASAADRANAATAKPSPDAQGSTTSPLVLARGVRIQHVTAGDDAAKVIREAREREKADGRDLLVYVGATWCEPCKRFHEAARKGELDDAFPNLTLLEFDLDEDRDRLGAAGYRSKMIPLFVAPNDDGRASNKRIEGSVKGNGAVADIAPRLRALLTN